MSREHRLQRPSELGGALEAQRRTHAILDRLAAADPRNAGLQRDLSVSHERIGDALTAQGDLGGALEVYRRTHAMLDRLAAADPRNAGWQRDLVVSLHRIASSLEGDAAREYWLRCLLVLRGMKQRRVFMDPPIVGLLDQLEQAFPSA